MTEPANESCKHTVLVVDDEPGILRSVKRVLRREGYRVELAEGGRAGIEYLENNPVSLVICDQRMPDVPGSEVLARAFELQPDAFRITLTGYTDMEAAQKSINEGRVNQFLTKPWNDDHLKQCVADGVRAHQLILDNRELESRVKEQNDRLEAWNQELEQAVKTRTSELQKRNRQLDKMVAFFENMLRDTVVVLASMLEMASPALGIHSKRVSELSKRMGQWLKVDANTLRDIEFAAYLHDLGKMSAIAISGSSTKLKKHDAPEIGYRILSRIAGFKRIAEGVLHQAERFDGTGGPHKLQAEKIPLVSRIIAIADTYDTAMFSGPDPTKPDEVAAQKAVERMAGRALDPQLVRLFLDKLRADSESIHGKDDLEVEISPRQARPGMTLARDLVNTEEVLLAKAGTVLTEPMIENITAMADAACILGMILVRVSPKSPSQQRQTRDQAA